MLRVFSHGGGLLALTAPLLPDYIDSKSIGLASALLTLNSGIANITSNSAIPFVASILSDKKWVFYSYGLFSILVSILLSFGIRDVIQEQSLFASRTSAKFGLLEEGEKEQER